MNNAKQTSSSSLKSLFSFLKSNPNYRADIDGLRAIACLAVVLYHAFPGHLPGGFIGVDIFFVISGYLISSILYRHLFNQDNPGKVHIVDFYSRRVRRIFPALILVLVTTFVLGTVLLYPNEFKLVLIHIIGGSTYISNFILYNESGDYFDVASNFKPLLHLWSLGVEEQFYLVFPIFLWVIYKLNLNFVLSLALFSIVSFFINYNAVKHGHVSRAFFMPWTRFWELSLGAVLAYVEFEAVNNKSNIKLIKRIKSLLSSYLIVSGTRKICSNTFSIIGCALIIIGLSTIVNDGVYPGTKALIPVLGAIFIIASGKDAFINRQLLSNKVMVFLGLISYPLYLWHWPLLSYTFIVEGEDQLTSFRIAVIVVSLILATVTFLFIEPKLRYGKHGGLKAIALLVVMIVITAASAIKYQQYKSTEVLSTVEFHKKYFGGQNTPQFYVKGTIDGDARLLVIGDSYARQYAPYFDKKIAYEGFYTDGNMCYKKLNAVTCSWNNLDYQNIVSDIENAIQNTVSNRILIAYNFTENFNKYPKDKATEFLSDLKQQLIYFADKYKSKDFYILEQNYTVPSLIQCFYNKEFKFIPNMIMKSIRSDVNECSKFENYRIKRNELEKISIQINELIENVSLERKNLHFLKMRDITCSQNSCKLFDQYNHPLFSDNGHLSIWGRDIVAPVLLKRMNIEP